MKLFPALPAVLILLLLLSGCADTGQGEADAPRDSSGPVPADVGDTGFAPDEVADRLAAEGDTFDVPVDLVHAPEVSGDTVSDSSPDLVADAAIVDLHESDPDVAPDAGTAPVIGPPGQFTRNVVLEGVSRNFQLYVPQSAVNAMASGPAPLLVALHGAGDNGGNFIAATGLTGAADANAFVLAGPEGFNKGWFV